MFYPIEGNNKSALFNQIGILNKLRKANYPKG